MTIQILDELKIYTGEGWEQSELWLWLIVYDRQDRRKEYRAFVDALAAFCEEKGWLLECGDGLSHDQLLAALEGDGP